MAGKGIDKRLIGVILYHSISKRQIIHFTDEAYQELRDYVKAKYGEHRAISFVVQQAVEQFLEREKIEGEKEKAK